MDPSSGTRKEITLATSYRVAFFLAVKFYLKTLLETKGFKRFLRGLPRVFAPIDLVRFREIQFINTAVNFINPEKALILDLGSPNIPSLTIARTFPNSRVLYTNIWFPECRETKAAANFLSITNLNLSIQDARHLGLGSNLYDLVLSISVFEHIEPENKGDVPAAKELERILKPGGHALITVPFTKKAFSEYLANGIYGRTPREGNPLFFQRFYDKAMLFENIILPSTLELVSLKFIDDRFFPKNPHKRLFKYVNSKGIHRIMFGLFYYFLATLFLSKPRDLEKTNNPYLCCIHLKKP